MADFFLEALFYAGGWLILFTGSTLVWAASGFRHRPSVGDLRDLPISDLIRTKSLLSGLLFWSLIGVAVWAWL
ncbi:hypothetical protein Poly30_15890 [Planctomycetes bacterium Poly30]|uniref:Uncharacterized protein n=1 Tax=Saltatorellus ferox TaxID=2528018 RepID=A0A518EPR9_9BACT|nr:hypothetical protein Poly30_15890 [Planctomycetes bacterium Poly30]